jgi:hypothetical protein
MGTVILMTTGQIERVGRKIQTILKSLRHRKLAYEAAGNRPTRDTALDPLLDQLQHLRLRLDFQMRKLTIEPPLRPAEDRALEAAQAVVADASEMVDLLIWFGADLPDDDDVDHTATLGETA